MKTAEPPDLHMTAMLSAYAQGMAEWAKANRMVDEHGRPLLYTNKQRRAVARLMRLEQEKRTVR